jgi:hypothetical protein
LGRVSFVTAPDGGGPAGSARGPYAGRVGVVGERPPPLMVAAGLVAVEGLLVLAYGVLEAADLHSGRVTMGVTSAAFFLILGGGLVWFAWLVLQGRAWARSPILVAQVLFLGIAWNFRGGDTTWVTVGLGLVALVVLVGLLHPASMEALSGRSRDNTT